MTLMQSKDNKMSNVLLYIQTIFPQELKESLKELKESRSLSSFKLIENGLKGNLKVVFKHL